jgi:hypothetical protein
MPVSKMVKNGFYSSFAFLRQIRGARNVLARVSHSRLTDFI